MGVMTAQYFKEPGDPTWDNDQAIIAYMAFVKKYAPNESQLDAIGLSGYHNALMAEHVLKQAGDVLTRDNLIKQATTLKDVALPTLLPGMTLSNTPEDYRAYHSFQLSRFDGKGCGRAAAVKRDWAWACPSWGAGDRSNGRGPRERGGAPRRSAPRRRAGAFSMQRSRCCARRATRIPAPPTWPRPRACRAAP